MELKPCPFCGNPMKGFPDYLVSYKKYKKKIRGIYPEICTLECKHCTCTIQQAGATKEEAWQHTVNQWNRRLEL